MPTALRGQPARLAAALALALLVSPQATAEEPSAESLPVAEISTGGAPAVVTIRARRPDEGGASHGSGFLIAPDGTIVTALHVIDGADRVLVRTAAGKRYRRVGIRAYDVGSDLVVLQVAGAGLPVVELGASSGLRTGDPLVVIGNPWGLVRTVTEGILGAWRDPLPAPDRLEDEEIEEDREFGARRRVRAAPNTRILQISAPISPGSSGAPVFDRTGKVVGMAVAGVFYGEDLNFAIPADLIAPLLERDDALTLASFRRQADLARESLAEPHVQQARLALELGEEAEAQREIDAALQLFPGSGEALVLEGELLRRRGDLAAAELVLLEATRQRPESVNAWCQLGKTRLEASRQTGHSLAPAREAFEKALELDEGNAGASHGLGVIAYREGRLRSATEYLETASRAEPESADTSLWLGEVYLRTQRAYDAERAFADSLDRGADPPLAHHGLARAYAAVGQDERSRQHYREFLELSEGVPELEALRERTILYLRHYPHLMPLEYLDLLEQRSDPDGRVPAAYG